MKKTISERPGRIIGISALLFLFAACFIFTLPADARAAVLWADTTPDVPITSPRTVRSVALLSAPTKTVYHTGEALNVVGGRIEITYTDDSTSDFAISLNWCSGYDSSKTGKQTVTVAYPDGGSPLSFSVTVRAESGIEIVSPPTKTVYFVGNTPNRNGLSVRLKYTDGTYEPLTSGYTVTGFDTSVAGNKTVVVGYMGFTATFGITVKEPQITKIEIVKEPTKLSYYTGDPLDTSGLSVNAVYDSGKAEDVTSLTVVTGHKPDIAGSQTLTVSLSVGQNRFSDTFKITVIKLADEKIEVTRMPDKTAYFNGDEFDSAGIEITLTYNSGTTRILGESDVLEFSGFDSLTTGTKTVSVTYGGLSATFDVTVSVADGHVHTPGEYTLTREATCEAAGIETSICTVCGEIAATRQIDALPHKWGDWSVTLMPTSAEEGERTRVCTVCGTDESEKLPKLSQTLTDGVFTAVASGDYIFPYGATLDAKLSFGTLSGTELAAVNNEAKEKFGGEAVTTFEIFYHDAAGERFSPGVSVRYSAPLSATPSLYEKVILLRDGSEIESQIEGNSIVFDSSVSGTYLVVGILPAPETEPVTTLPQTTETPVTTVEPKPETSAEPVTASPDVTSDNQAQPSDSTPAPAGMSRAYRTILVVVGIVVVIGALLGCIYLYVIKYMY